MRIALAATVVLAIGCAQPPRSGSGCATHADCSGGEACIGGQCVAAPFCMANRDCPSDMACSDGRCADVSCARSADCGADRVCTSGHCVEPPVDHCDGPGDCPGGACDLATNRCVLDVEACGDGGACPADEICAEGACVAPPCEADGDCRGGRYCTGEGVCAPGCRVEPDNCDLERRCDPGTRRCVGDADPDAGVPPDAAVPEDAATPPEDAAAPPDQGLPACDADGDCEGDEYCDAGVCRVGCRAASCPAGWLCDVDRHICVEDRGCEGDAACPPGLFCDDGHCAEGCRTAPDDCGEGRACEQLSRACRCLADAGCEAAEFCDDGACQVGCRVDPDSCPMGACDPATRRCACAEDAHCPDGQYCTGGACEAGCRVEPDDCGEDSACDPDRRVCVCDADGACPDGRFCEDGACVGGCRVEPDDCPDGFACDVERRVCGCVADAACLEGTFCDEAGECAAGCRLDPDDCGRESACDPASRRCVCAADEGCPAGQVCDAGACRGGCRRDGDCQVGACDPDTRTCVAAECARDADCGEDEACIILEAPLGPGFVLGCAPALADGRAEDACASGLECASRTCVGREFCFSACVDGDDCPTGDCRGFTVGAGADRTQFLTCERPPDLCEGDAQCEDEQMCLPIPPAEDTPNQVRTACVEAPPRAAVGEPCNRPQDCASVECLPIGVCWGPCRPGVAGECLGGQRCYIDILHFIFDQGTPSEADDRFWGMNGCLPDVGSDAPCADGRCPDGEGCRLYASRTLDDLEPRCRTSPGNRRGGALCDAHDQCRSGTCLNDTFCLGVCDGNIGGNQCAAGSVCGRGTFTLWDRGTPGNPADDVTAVVNVCVR